MKSYNGTLKIFLVALLAIGSLFSLSACSQPEAEDNLSQEPTVESPVSAESGDTVASSETAESENIVALASTNDSLQTLTQAIEAAGLTETLSGEGPFTVFAPTDAAFAALPEGAVEELLKPENRDQLVQLLKYHVVPGEVTSAAIVTGEVSSVEGTPLNVVVDEGTSEVKVNEAKVTKPDIKASNGVIHVIDTVMLPLKS
ncbi:fasciclin domain-containing protein [Lyngbya aestuarii]|uniref:fasciclin domain-containing protein n=1 Tax=Lyngbya aestuarii TaxID=118322 RepID=UPI00403DF49E